MKTITTFSASLYSNSLKSLFSLLFFAIGILSIAQNVGDYQSKNTGNWNTSSSWEIYNGSTWVAASNYPGQTTNPNAKVTILECHYITNTTNINISIHDLTVKGILLLANSLNLLTSNQLIIDGGSVRWTNNNVDLRIPQNAGLIILSPKNICTPFDLGFSAEPCNNTQAMYIGQVKYTACKGQGNTSYGTFEEVNNAGGSLMAAPGADLNAICTGSTQQPTLYGNAVQYGSFLGTLTYQWTFVSGPSPITITLPATQNFTLPVLSVDGNYIFKLEVSTSNHSHSKEITISVGGTTEFKTDSVNGNYWTHDIPSETNHRKAIINANYDTDVHDSFDACSCQVNSGKSLTIKPDTYVKLLNELNNQGQVIIEDGGILYQVNDNAVNIGSVEVQKLFTFDDSDPNNVRKQYNFVTSPVVGQNLKNIYPNAVVEVVSYRESTNYFYNHTGQYIPGKGLAVREPSKQSVPDTDETAKFTGIPANGVITYQVGYSGQPDDENSKFGYDLIGNPYPSSLDLHEFYNDNKNIIKPTFYFWDNRGNTQYTQQGSNYNGNNYAMYNVLSHTGLEIGDAAEGAPDETKKPTRYVKSGTGFMIQAKQAGTIQFKNSYRSIENSNPSFFGRLDDSMDRFYLGLKTPTNLVHKSAIVYFEHGNNAYGLEDSKASDSSNEIFTISDQNKLAINGRSIFEDSDQIDLGVRHFQAGTYSIGLSSTEGVFANGQTIYLKDKQLNLIHNLSESDYTYQAVGGEQTNRFQIVFQNESIVEEPEEPIDTNEVSISKQGNFFVLQSSPQKIKEIEIYNLTGNMLQRKKNINSHQHKIQSNSLEKGVLYVHVYLENGEKVIKSIINN